VSYIKPHRLEASRVFPYIGFSIATGMAPAWFEVVITSNPALLDAGNRAQRTPENFYSSGGDGLLPATGSECVYLVPPVVLERFSGGSQLAYAMAVYGTPDGRNPVLVRMPQGAQPITLSASFATSGRRPRAGSAASRAAAAGSPRSLVWGGDAAAPGSATGPGIVPAPAPVLAGAGAGAGAPSGPGLPPLAPPPQQAQSLAYSDGFDDDFWASVQEDEGDAASDDTATEPAITDDPAAEQPEGDYDDASDDGDLTAIDGPIPEDSDGTQPDEPAVAAAAWAAALAAPASDHPGATFQQARYFRRRKAGRVVDRIVLHITDGTTIASATSWFNRPGLGRNEQASAHYVVGQDGSIVQLVRDADIAFHAIGANANTIGIEHVATAGWVDKKGRTIPRTMPTATQLSASAALVRRLARKFGVPLDRQHIIGHTEADPKTPHKGCVTSVWDWKAYMALLAAPAGGAPGGVYYNMNLVPQPTKTGAWASAMAMLVGEAESRNVDPEEIAAAVGASLRSSYGWDTYAAAADRFGFQQLQLPSNVSLDASPANWEQWLTGCGPLLVLIEGGPSHAVVVHGIQGDGSPGATTIWIADPWDSTQQFDGDPVDFRPANAGRMAPLPFAELEAQFGSIATVRHGSWRILYLPALVSRATTPPDGPAAQSLSLRALDPVAVEAMRATLVGNPASGAGHMDCITLVNAALRQLLGASVPQLGSRINRTMEALVAAGIAQPPIEFGFVDARGQPTGGVAEPVALASSVEDWMKSEADALQLSGWYVFGLSVLDGYHSVLIAMSFAGATDPSTRVYWCDQIYGGFDDVTGGLDARLATRTQAWWNTVLIKDGPKRKPRTTATLWPVTAQYSGPCQEPQGSVY